MTIRPRLLFAALALLAVPAFAQDNAEEEVPPAADNPAPADEAPADTPPEAAPDPAAAPPPAPAPVEPAVPPASAPAPEPAPAPAPAAAPPPALAPVTPQPAPPSPFSPDQRAGWLAQCRATFQRAGAALGGGPGRPDACETQLLDFERSYVPTPGADPPVIWVRLPRAPAAPAPAVDADLDPDPAESPEE